MGKYTLGVDIGTTNLCVVLVDSYSHDVLKVVDHKNDTLLPADDGACFEQDAVKIIEAVLGLFERMISGAQIDPHDIAGVAITGQMHGVVLVDENLQAQTPLYTWRDRRSETSGVLAEIRKRLPAEYNKKTGCRLAAGYGGATLCWLLQDQAMKDKIQSYKALTIADYLAAVLTGNTGIDYSHAASWGVFDIVSNCWAEDMLQVMGIPVSILPPVMASGKVLGYIGAEAAGKTLLAEGTKVWVPIGDNQASFYGATKAQQSVAVINIGTSGQITLPSEIVCVDNGIETRPLPGGGYIYVGAILCGGWSYAYLARFFKEVLSKLGGVEIDNDILYANMRNLLADYQKNGLVVDTKFSGTRDGLGVQSGSINCIDEVNLTPENLTYGFLRGIVQELADMVPESAEVEKSWSLLRATGNAIRLNPILVSIIEDVFGVECELSAATEEAASGAAFVALSHGE